VTGCVEKKGGYAALFLCTASHLNESPSLERPPATFRATLSSIAQQLNVRSSLDFFVPRFAACDFLRNGARYFCEEIFAFA
jgi:hypothetical protein